MNNKQKIYYKNEQSEVVQFKNKEIKIDENYKYLPSSKLKKFISLLSYKFFAIPVAYIYIKAIKGVKFVNRDILKKYNNSAYFVYANHTNQLCDGFCPSIICSPKQPKFIVNSANISIPFWGKFTKMWGALPIPNTIGASKNFNDAVEKTIQENNPIIIYPEAHLWPYYTNIREFPIVSFRYPVKYNVPVFTFTTTYQKRKFGKTPQITIFIDGPFFANKTINEKESQKILHATVYNKLKERAKLSNYEFINYIRRNDD